MLGSTALRVERAGTREGPLRTRAGILLGTDTGMSGIEEFGLVKGDTDCVAEHQIGAGGGDGGGAPVFSARES